MTILLPPRSQYCTAMDAYVVLFGGVSGWVVDTFYMQMETQRCAKFATTAPSPKEHSARHASLKSCVHASGTAPRTVNLSYDRMTTKASPPKSHGCTIKANPPARLATNEVPKQDTNPLQQTQLHRYTGCMHAGSSAQQPLGTHKKRGSSFSLINCHRHQAARLIFTTK